MKIYKTAQFEEVTSNPYTNQPTGDPDSTLLTGQSEAHLDVDWESLNEWYLTGGEELPDPLPKEGVGNVVVNFNYSYDPYDTTLETEVNSVWINNNLIKDRQILFIFDDYYDDEIKKQFWEMTKNI